MNRLYYGDNLDIIPEHIPRESIDLVYPDPPFNSNRSYNVLFSGPTGEARAQIQAFDDTWTWTTETHRLFDNMMSGSVPAKVADAVQSFRLLLGENDVLAYLVSMAPRLVALHRISMQKPTRGMVDAANKSGLYKWPVTGTTYPRIQLLTVAQLLEGFRPELPPTFMPYLRAQPVPDSGEQLSFKNGD